MTSHLQALANKTKELEKLKFDWSTHTASLTNEHSALLNAEKERAIQVRMIDSNYMQ